MPQLDAFLEIKPIPGESTDKKHPNTHELLKHSYEIFHNVTGSFSTGAAHFEGRLHESTLDVAIAAGTASPKFYEFAAKATPIPEMKLFLHGAQGEKGCYMEYTFRNCYIQSFKFSNQTMGDSPKPVDLISFTISESEVKAFKFDHAAGKAQGTAGEAKWNFTTNS